MESKVFFVNYIVSCSCFLRDSFSFWLGREGLSATKWILVHPFHLAQDLALIHGQHGGVLPHLLEHGTTLKLIACLLEIVPEEEKQKEKSVIRKCGA